MDQVLFDRIASLSRLSFSGEERERMAKDMEEILRLMDTVAEVPLASEAAPTAAGSMELLREDAVKPSLSAEEALSNAKGRQGDFFAVPKMID